MVRVFAYLSVFLMLGGFLADPANYAAGGHDQRMAHLLVDGAGNPHHEANGSHGDSQDDPGHHGALHCPASHCAPTLFIQTGDLTRRAFEISSAFRPSEADDALRSTYLESDPPIPRFSA
jgi:hypothetical protein